MIIFMANRMHRLWQFLNIFIKYQVIFIIHLIIVFSMTSLNVAVRCIYQSPCFKICSWTYVCVIPHLIVQHSNSELMFHSALTCYVAKCLIKRIFMVKKTAEWLLLNVENRNLWNVEVKGLLFFGRVGGEGGRLLAVATKLPCSSVLKIFLTFWFTPW